jgi:hypothetical protein
MTRHEFLSGLHRALKPRTYLEVGINDGASLELASCRVIGVDPSFRISTEVHAEIDLFRTTSDEFFATRQVGEIFGGLSLDLAFIDGMHHAEFAYRDFVNIERNSTIDTVVVFDDMLPRTLHEAARTRLTRFWAGDVYKVADVLRRRRTDLLIVPVNTSPTGMLVVLGLDPQSTALADCYESELEFLTQADPQEVPDEVLQRQDAVDPQALLRQIGLSGVEAMRLGGATNEARRDAIAQALRTATGQAAHSGEPGQTKSRHNL